MLLTLSALVATSLMQAEAAPPQPAKSEKKICRVAEGVSGSRVPRRTCKTAGEWEAEAQGRTRSFETIDRGAIRGGQ